MENIEEKLPDFSLTPILNEDNQYSLTHFEEVKQACLGFIEENTIDEIKTDEDLSDSRKCRTALRKKSEQIKKVRLALVKLFSFQFIELESMLNSMDSAIKDLQDEYKAKKEAEEVAVAPAVEEEVKEIKLVIKYRDSKVIGKVKDLLLKNNCEVIEIKEKK